MKKLFLTFYLFFFFAFGWCQNVEIYLFDTETNSTIPHTKILITDNQLNFLQLLTTDETGCVSFYVDDSIKKIDELNVNILLNKYNNDFISLQTKDLQNTRIIREYSILKACNLFLPLTINYEKGKIYFNDISSIDSLFLITELKELTNLIPLNITYSKFEKNGFQLSHERINYLIKYLAQFGIKKERFRTSIIIGETPNLVIDRIVQDKIVLSRNKIQTLLIKNKSKNFIVTSEIEKNEFKLVIQSYYLSDSLSLDDTYDFVTQTPIILKQELIFYKNNEIINQRILPIQTISAKTTSNQTINYLNSDIHSIEIVEGNKGDFYYVYGSGFCFGAKCPEFGGYYDLNGNILFESYIQKTHSNEIQKIYDEYGVKEKTKKNFILVNPFW